MVNCFSIYGGPNLDFENLTILPENPPPPATIKNRLWVDVWDEVELQPQLTAEGRLVLREVWEGGKVSGDGGLFNGSNAW